MLTNYHTHTTCCDGKNTPGQIAQRAAAMGFDALGFSGHGFTGFHQRYCMKDLQKYKTEVLQLRREYAGRMQIYLGVEEDMWEPVNAQEFDYIIGSCHFS